MWESRRLCEISKELWIEWETCRWFSTRSIVSSFPQLSAGVSTTKPGPGRHGICHLNPHQIAKNQKLANVLDDFPAEFLSYLRSPELGAFSATFKPMLQAVENGRVDEQGG